MSAREVEKRAHRAMVQWAIVAVVGEVVALASAAPAWLRVVVGALSLLTAFFAGLVAIPKDGEAP